MKINTDPATSTVTDYDFMFDNGSMLPVTLDPSYGDTLTTYDDHFVVYLAPKPGLDPTKMLPAEEVTIFKAHLLSFQKRTRLATKLTADQQFQWNKDLDSMKTI